MAGAGNAQSIFVNCPYDKAYLPRFWALVFAIYDAGFRPRAALELDDSSKTRLSRIVRLIKSCPYSVHDLCRADEPRFNMPFEVGLAFGLSERQDRTQAHTALILTTSKNKFDRVCSDLCGVDLHTYRGADGLVIETTAWLQQFFDPKISVPNPRQTAARFKQFWRQLPRASAQADRDHLSPTWYEMLGAVHSYIAKNPPKAA
jgi:hypothetical protein